MKSNTLNPEWEELVIDVENLFPSELPEKRRDVILRSVDFRFFGFANYEWDFYGLSVLSEGLR